MALKAWHLDSEQLLSRLSVPHADVVDRASSEKIRQACREGDVVDAIVMTSVSELRGDSITVAPVDGGLGGASEEVSGVSSDRDGSASTHDLVLALHLHELVRDLELSDGAITRSDEKIAVLQELEAVDALREEVVTWADSLENSPGETDFDDVASEGSHVGA